MSENEGKTQVLASTFCYVVWKDDGKIMGRTRDRIEIYDLLMAKLNERRRAKDKVQS